MADNTCADCHPEVQDQQVDPETSNSHPEDYNPALDASTFVPPTALPAPSVTIEFCNRCRWLHRATWVSTELFLTFPPPALKGIHLVPLTDADTAGRFRVWLLLDSGPALLWDRKIEGGFPELKVLKQRLRDKVDPSKSLGHSEGHALST